MLNTRQGSWIKGRAAPLIWGFFVCCFAACNEEKTTEVTVPELAAETTSPSAHPESTTSMLSPAGSESPKRCRPELAPTDPHPVLNHPLRPIDPPKVQAFDTNKGAASSSSTPAVAARRFAASAPAPVSAETASRYENYTRQLRTHAAEFKSLPDAERQRTVAQLKAKIVLGGAP